MSPPSDGAAKLVASGSAMLALCVLADSAMEHDRGSFRNPVMWLPLASSALAMGTGGASVLGHGGGLVLRRASQGGSAGVGVLGLGFHAFNIAKRPGGLSFLNLMRAAPIGAPAALVLAGLLGAAGDAIEQDRLIARPLAGLTALGLAGTVAEAGLLHFRGAFQNRAMWLPLAVPPLAAFSLARDALGAHPRRVTAGLLGVTALLGLMGSAFHAYGIARRMGGWRNWRQSLLAGPPLPAPPAFTGLAIAGIGALLAMGLTLRKGRAHAIETPRLLLASANERHREGLGNSSGLVGRNLMVQLNQAVWGQVEDEVRSYKAPPSLALSEHWNYEDRGKDYFGGWCYMSQGPLPAAWAQELAGGRGLWGQALVDEMNRANHSVGLKMVGEVLPSLRNRVRLADELDQHGLRVARVTFSYGDNERAMMRHALDFMDSSLAATGAGQRWKERDDTCHLGGTARMGFNAGDSVVDADCRSWDIPNLWVCDGSVFPTVGGVNPSLTIQAIACRTADRIKALAARGELHDRARG